MISLSLADFGSAKQFAQQMLINMIRQKFHFISAYHLAMLEKADEQQLLDWTVKLSVSNQLEAVLGETPKILNPQVAILLNLLRLKFKQVPDTYLKQLAAADEADLTTWTTRFKPLSRFLVNYRNYC